MEEKERPQRAERSARIPPGERKIIAYRLEPVYEAQEDDVLTAAVMSCFFTGEMLAGMGGGGLFMSPALLEALRTRKYSLVEREWLKENLDRITQIVEEVKNPL